MTPRSARSLSVLMSVVLVAVGWVVGACGGSDGASPDGASATTVVLTGEASRGRTLVEDLGCTACHSVDGREGVGPTFAGLYGSQVDLEDGTTRTADVEYLTGSIDTPSVDVVKGFRPIMPERTLPADEVAAIVSYLESLGS